MTSFPVTEQPGTEPDLQADLVRGLQLISANNGEQDVSRGLELCLFAAGAGHAQAQYEIGRMYHEGVVIHKSVDMAEMWLVKASMNGYMPATELLDAISQGDTLPPVSFGGIGNDDLASGQADVTSLIGNQETQEKRAQRAAERLKTSQHKRAVRFYIFGGGLLTALAALVGLLKYLSLN